MSHSYSQNHLHIVFSTKERQKLIEPAMQPKLWSYMAGIGRNHGVLVLANGGMNRPRPSADPVATDTGASQSHLSAKSKFRSMDE